MTGKKEFVYCGVLRQPAFSLSEREWLCRLETLSAELGVVCALPLEIPYPTEWMRAVVRALMERHESQVAHITIPVIRDMKRAQLANELGRLTTLHVPGFGEAVRNAGRPSEWALAQQMILVSRFHRLQEKGSGCSLASAARELLPQYSEVVTAKHLARKFNDGRKQSAVMQLALFHLEGDKLEKLLLGFALSQERDQLKVKRCVSLVKAYQGAEAAGDLGRMGSLRIELQELRAKFSDLLVMVLERDILPLWDRLGELLEKAEPDSEITQFVNELEAELSRWRSVDA